MVRFARRPRAERESFELGAQVSCASGASVGRLREARQHQVVERRRDFFAGGERGGRRLGQQVLGANFDDGVTFERRVAGEQLVHDGAERVQVRARANRGGVRDGLRREVQRRASRVF